MGLGGNANTVATKPKTKPAAPVTNNAAPAAKGDNTAARSPADDSFETFYKDSVKNADKTSPEATKALASLTKRADMTPAEHYAETEGFRKDMGVDTKAMLEGQRATQRGMSEDVEKRGKYEMHMRNAQLFAKIASTPGPILSAAAKAMNDLIPEMIEDGEKREKAQNEIKKALAALDMSEYLDKAGKADKALESRNAANVALMSAQMEIDKAKRDSKEKAMTSAGTFIASRNRDVSNVEAARIAANARGAGSSMAAEKLDLQGIDKANKAFLDETENQRKALDFTKKALNATKDSDKKATYQLKINEIQAEIDATRKAVYKRFRVDPASADVGAKSLALPPGFKEQ